MSELQSVIDSFRRDVDRSQLLARLEAAEADVAAKAAEAKEIRLQADVERNRVKLLTAEINDRDKEQVRLLIVCGL